jgi:hypothetical protein
MKASHDIVDEDYFDRNYSAAEKKEIARPPVNKFDGMIHAQNGKIFDPATLREVDTDIDSMAVQTKDWYDKDFDAKNTFTGEPIANVQKR